MVFWVIFLFLLLTAVSFDLESGRIPNWLIILMWLGGTGFALVRVSGGEEERLLTDRLMGGGLPLVILFPLFKLRLFGAGDIKLISAIGTFLGLRGMLDTTAAAFFLAGLISLALMASDASFSRQLSFFGRFVRQRIRGGGVISYHKEEKSRLHFSLPLLMGSLLKMGGIL